MARNVSRSSVRLHLRKPRKKSMTPSLPASTSVSTQSSTLTDLAWVSYLSLTLSPGQRHGRLWLATLGQRRKHSFITFTNSFIPRSHMEWGAGGSFQGEGKLGWKSSCHPLLWPTTQQVQWKKKEPHTQFTTNQKISEVQPSRENLKTS